jgi:hypothetical protein
MLQLVAKVSAVNFLSILRKRTTFDLNAWETMKKAYKQY